MLLLSTLVLFVFQEQLSLHALKGTTLLPRVRLSIKSLNSTFQPQQNLQTIYYEIVTFLLYKVEWNHHIYLIETSLIHVLNIKPSFLMGLCIPVVVVCLVSFFFRKDKIPLISTYPETIPEVVVIS